MMLRWAFFFLVISVSAHSTNAPELRLLRKLPHKGYSEGLDYFRGSLWHALPKEIVRIDPETGEVRERFAPPSAHSESLAWFQGKLLNLSFENNAIYRGELVGGARGSARRFQAKQVGTTPEVHGWGITVVRDSIVITGDYSPKLYFLDPSSFKVRRTITAPVSDLEDLAWDGTSIWTSSFTQYRGHVFALNPADGSMTGMYRLGDGEECPVIDGIAYDEKGFWITGKECPSLYYVARPGAREIAEANDFAKELKRSNQ